MSNIKIEWKQIDNDERTWGLFRSDYPDYYPIEIIYSFGDYWYVFGQSIIKKNNIHLPPHEPRRFETCDLAKQWVKDEYKRLAPAIMEW